MSDQNNTTTSPAPVAVTQPKAGSVVPQGHLTVSGTGEPGAAITVTLDGGSPIATAVVDATGAWSCTTTTFFVNSATTRSEGETIDVTQQPSNSTEAESGVTLSFWIEYDDSLDNRDAAYSDGQSAKPGVYQDLR